LTKNGTSEDQSPKVANRSPVVASEEKQQPSSPSLSSLSLSSSKQSLSKNSSISPFEEGLYNRYSTLEEIFHVTDPSTNHTVESLLNNGIDVKDGEHPAVCEFSQQSKIWYHFPHAFQQLLRCISWWNAKENKHRTSILTIWNFPTSWGKSFIDILQHQWPILLDRNATYKSWSVYGEFPNTHHLDGAPAYEMAHPSDAEIVRTKMKEYFLRHNTTTTTTTTTTTEMAPTWRGGCPSSFTDAYNKTEPVIGFLNRKPTTSRHVTNFQEVVAALKTALSPSEGNFLYLESFDGMSFEQQFDWMANIDILIGPHGAQVTNAAFIPHCGSILEFFPKGYFVPHFFGTLARSTGHYYFSMYTGDFETMEQDLRMGALKRKRDKFRKGDITVNNVQNVVQATMAMINKWSSCCQRL
jgi:hypothetical protein